MLHASCPDFTSKFSSCSILIPPPLTVGFGSNAPITTFFIPAHNKASVQGGVLPTTVATDLNAAGESEMAGKLFLAEQLLDSVGRDPFQLSRNGDHAGA